MNDFIPSDGNKKNKNFFYFFFFLLFEQLFEIEIKACHSLYSQYTITKQLLNKLEKYVSVPYFCMVDGWQAFIIQQKSMIVSLTSPPASQSWFLMQNPRAFLFFFRLFVEFCSFICLFFLHYLLLFSCHKRKYFEKKKEAKQANNHAK